VRCRKMDEQTRLWKVRARVAAAVAPWLDLELLLAARRRRIATREARWGLSPCP
jgi:hypothetical protein